MNEHYQQVIRKALSRYEKWDEYDDILATANLEVWKALRDWPEAEQAKGKEGLVYRIAQRAAGHHLMSPGCLSTIRNRNRHNKEIIPTLSLDQLLEGGEGSEDNPWLSVEPDFAPRVTERLWRGDCLNVLEHCLEERDWQVMEGMSQGKSLRHLSLASGKHADNLTGYYKRMVRHSLACLRIAGLM